MKDIYIKKEFVTEESFAELDFDLQQEFGFMYDDDDSEFHEIAVDPNPVDTYPIRIDCLINSLQRMADLGATHVELDYHCDHIGYDLAGFKIALATSAEIEAELEKKRKEIDIREKRADLLRQLNELKRQDYSTSNEDEDLPF